MSLSFRKSINAGPFRINFSKSGISYSMGVKGARVNIGPKGTFVNLSSHGITYRRKISGHRPGQLPTIPQQAPVYLENIHNIASADIEQLTDSDSTEFISELTQKAGQISYVSWFGVLPLIIFLIVISMSYSSNRYAGYELLAGIIGFILLIRWLSKLDKKRFEMELHYDMDEQFQQIYQQFAQHFKTFSCSHRIWQYLNVHNTNDYKRNAGAGKLIRRVVVQRISTDQKPVPYFITNVAIPHLKLSNIEFYFLPERLVIKRGNTFAAVFYKNLRISGSPTRFIESEGVPGDAVVVDHTWKYVNKKGGPDRRFNDNRRLPICLYSEYSLSSDTGIYEVITTSKQEAMDAFANFLTQIGNLQSRMAIQ